MDNGKNLDDINISFDSIIKIYKNKLSDSEYNNTILQAQLEAMVEDRNNIRKENSILKSELAKMKLKYESNIVSEQ